MVQKAIYYDGDDDDDGDGDYDEVDGDGDDDDVGDSFRTSFELP